MTKYHLTIAFEDLDTFKEVALALAEVTGKQTATDTEDTKTRKTRTGKTTNGKTDDDGKPAATREKALQICRDLMESGDDSVKKDLKALRDAFEVKKLSDVPLEAAAEFLTKAQKLQDKHSV
jgi:hypothetical protein